MKIQCNVCEMAEADVLCCADEAALCRACDQLVHHVNKLASKHQRVRLYSSPTQIPMCDICQESLGFFFCLDDRALLCRKCDLAIHTANSLVSLHRRFLLTGVKVSLNAAGEDVPSSSNAMTRTHSLSTDQMPPPQPRSRPNIPPPAQPSGHQVQPDGQHSGVIIPAQGDNPVGNYTLPLLTYAGGSGPDVSTPVWQLDEFLDLSGYNQNDNMDNNASKVDSGKQGDSDCSPVLRAADGEFEGGDCGGQVGSSLWDVPEIPSPPTSSGLHWTRSSQVDLQSSWFFVPEMGSQELHHRLTQGDGSNKHKRRS